MVSDDLLTVRAILFPPCLMRVTASVSNIPLVEKPLISNSTSPTYNNNIINSTNYRYMSLTLSRSSLSAAPSFVILETCIVDSVS